MIFLGEKKKYNVKKVNQAIKGYIYIEKIERLDCYHIKG